MQNVPVRMLQSRINSHLCLCRFSSHITTDGQKWTSKRERIAVLWDWTSQMTEIWSKTGSRPLIGEEISDLFSDSNVISVFKQNGPENQSKRIFCLVDCRVWAWKKKQKRPVTSVGIVRWWLGATFLFAVFLEEQVDKGFRSLQAGFTLYRALLFLLFLLFLFVLWR